MSNIILLSLFLILIYLYQKSKNKDKNNEIYNPEYKTNKPKITKYNRSSILTLIEECKDNQVNIKQWENIKFVKKNTDWKLSITCKKCNKTKLTSINQFKNNQTFCQNCNPKEVKKLKSQYKKGISAVYLIKLNNENKIKIGLSTNLIGRLTGNYSSGQKTGLLSEHNINQFESIYIETDNLKEMESKIHQEYSSYRLKNYGTITGKTEWFENGNHILEDVKNKYNTKPLPEIFKEN